MAEHTDKAYNGNNTALRMRPVLTLAKTSKNKGLIPRGNKTVKGLSLVPWR
jgi:hypothetical protein